MSEATMVDMNRVGGLIELAMPHYPDRERMVRFLETGASFFVRTEGDHLHLCLAHGPDAEAYSILRRDAPALPIHPDDQGEVLTVIRAPVDAVLPRPQG